MSSSLFYNQIYLKFSFLRFCVFGGGASVSGNVSIFRTTPRGDTPASHCLPIYFLIPGDGINLASLSALCISVKAIALSFSQIDFFMLNL